eukprot:COSAG04_NODE_25682_length_304_cov_1.009756_1_plen_45_part_10
MSSLLVSAMAHGRDAKGVCLHSLLAFPACYWYSQDRAVQAELPQE